MKAICPKADDIFLCPICLCTFERDCIFSGEIDDGHVWTKSYVKSFTSSQSALHKRVLLCSKCNSMSGTRCESVLIEFEKFRLMREAGQLYRPKATVVSTKEFGRVAKMKLPVIIDQEANRLQLQFKKHRKSKKLLYNPTEREAIEKLLKQDNCSLILEETYPFCDKWHIAQVALLTSAYLASFQAFGYRYILNSQLNEIREYILTSFKKKQAQIDGRLEAKGVTKIPSVTICREHFSDEPTIAFFPLTNDSPHFVEFSFRDYHIKLPYQNSFTTDAQFMPADNVRALVIGANNHAPHKGKCFIDELIGENNLSVVTGRSLILILLNKN